MTVAVVEGNESPATEAVETAEIVEAVGEAVAEAVEAATENQPEMPPATQGELAMSNAMLAACGRLEAVAARLEMAVETMATATIATVEAAATVADSTASLEATATQEAENVEILEPVSEEIEEEQADVAPSGFRHAMRNKWNAPKRR